MPIGPREQFVNGLKIIFFGAKDGTEVDDDGVYQKSVQDADRLLTLSDS